ncbi:MAG: matrixin family metalloprotease [Pseudonocardiales bacterium]|nr:matrixin family metalloprotease [Pseudonocardiales bacterium]
MGRVMRLRAWLRYRRMSRLLAELDRHDRQAAASLRVTTPLASRRRFISKGELIYALSFVAIVVVLLYVGSAFPGLVGKSNQHAGATHLPAPSTATTGPFSFLMTTPHGRPVTYDPCHPIHYVVNPTGMPSHGIMVIRDAIQTISAASGLTFTDDGLTQEKPEPDRPVFEPRRYGQRYAPVLIARADQAEYPLVGGDIAGVGGSTAFEPNGPESARFVTGEIVLDRDEFATILARDDGYAQARAIVMHELGHVVGLGHVRDPSELMAPEYSGQTGLGPGDREGLAQAGTGPCWPDI